jgi:prepilin-type N-terminal cleavage/methylation domain-containing protein
MRTMTTTTANRARRAGFTMMEILTTVVIVGVLATAVALPQMRTLEAAKRGAAVNVLNAIYAGERVYALANGDDYCAAPGAAPACSWDEIYVDDPNEDPPPPPVRGATVPGVSFAVTVNNAVNPQQFTATATRTGTGPCGGETVTIDQDRVIGGSWPASGAC